VPKSNPSSSSLQSIGPYSSFNLTSEFDLQFAPAPAATPFLSRPPNGVDAESIYQTDLENEEDVFGQNHNQLFFNPLFKPEEISASSPGLTNAFEKQIRGVGRGIVRKKRTRVDIDVMDTSSSLKKVIFSS
jgi:hypothetical protein